MNCITETSKIVPRWKKIKDAMEHPCRATRAKCIFELMEEERKAAVDYFKEYSLDGLIKVAVARSKYGKDSKDKVKNKKIEEEEEDE